MPTIYRNIGWIALFVAGLHAQVPKPFLQKNIADGSKQAEGNFSPLAQGVAPKLELLLAEKEAPSQFQPVPADFDVNLVRGTFRVTADVALKGEQRVKVRLTVVQASAESDVVEVAKKPSDTPLVLLSVEAQYGASVVAVNFIPVPATVGKPSIEVSVPDLYTVPRELTADELKAGRAEVKLPSPLLGGVVPPLVTVTAKPGNVLAAKTADPAAIRIETPIREGESSIKGSAHTTVQKVCVIVLGAAFGEDALPDLTKPLPIPHTCADARETLLAASAGSLSDRVAELKANPALTFSALAESAGNRTKMRVPSILPEHIDLIKRSSNVQLRDAAAELAGPELDSAEASVDPSSHAFEIKLHRPLEGGSKVLVREIFTSAPGGPQTALAGPTVNTVESAGLDFGRARAFFTVGAVLSQSAQTFGEAHPYVSFSIDGSFIGHVISKRKLADMSMVSISKVSDYRDLFNNAGFGASLHWFSAARLTQTGTAVATGSVSLQQAQSGVFLAGLYAPMRVRGMDWVYHGVQYSSFVAPLAKVGVTVVKDGVTLATTTTTTVTSLANCPLADCSNFDKADGPNTKLTSATGPAPFYGYGFRTGIMKYTLMGRQVRNRQIAPDPVMYLDVTWGQNQVYVTPGTIATSTDTVTNAGVVTKTSVKRQNFTFERRVAVEGRLKIPYLPAEIGADVNLALRSPLRSVAGTGTGNYTDFRFIIGFRIDAAKVLFSVFENKK